jgi:hypothetical protein
VLVLTRLVAGKVDEGEAALLLGLSPRSIRRLKARYIESGPAALTHGNRGRRPAHALDPGRLATSGAWCELALAQA